MLTAATIRRKEAALSIDAAFVHARASAKIGAALLGWGWEVKYGVELD
jgi:hypothetical protein